MVFNILFTILLFVSIFLFITGRKIESIFILFFFFTDGFQLLPLDDMKIGGLGDFAIAQTLLLALYARFFGGVRLHQLGLKIVRPLKILFITLGIICISNIFYLKISPVDCIVTLRPFIFLLAFYFLPMLDDDDISKLKKTLFYITIFQSVLFILQVIFNVQILNGYFGGEMLNFGLFSIPRCYNFPFLLPYFLFQIFFSDLAKGSLKLPVQLLFVFTIILPQHRSMIAVLVVLFLYAILVKRGSLVKSLKYIAIFVILFFALKTFLSERFDSGTASDDIEQAINGSFEDFDLERDAESTMFYRVAMLSERLYYISDNPITALFGGGLMREGTPKAEQLNFFVIYFDAITRTDYQVSTPDIAWSMIFFRFGFAGAIVFILFFSSITGFLKRNHSLTDYALPSHLFMLFLIFTSFTGSDLYKIWPFLLPIIDYISVAKEIPEPAEDTDFTPNEVIQADV